MTGRPAAPEPLAVTLANPRADRVKQVKALAGRSARGRAGTMIVEGPQAVREAVECAGARVVDLYLTPEADERHPGIRAAALDSGRYVHGATPEVLHAMSADAQGIVAVVSIERPTLADAIASAPTLVIVLNDVRDPGNAGTIIRAADAAGAHLVILAGDSVDATNPKVVRATAGSLFHVPVIEDVSLAQAVSALRDAGLRVLAADGGGDLVLGGEGADRRALAMPTAWVFGNEAHGLSPDERSLADAVVRIPIYGRAESLNLAAAVAVCLYAGGPGRLPPNGPAVP